MIVRLARLLGLVAVTVSCGGLFTVGYGQALPVQELLNPDGTLNLQTGVSGCVDISGHWVRLDAERGPVFVPLAVGSGQEGASALSGPHTEQEAPAPMALGEAWYALGSGVDGEVLALAVSDGTLYAGGDFTTAGGVAANRIAKWDGTSWSALGSGMDDYVFALAVSDGTLYAGGGFITAGGEPANYVAKWGVVAFTNGDVNGDGIVDLIDVRLCAQIAQGYITGTPQQLTAADVDSDGDVDMDDVTILSEYILGVRTTLP